MASWRSSYRWVVLLAWVVGVVVLVVGVVSDAVLGQQAAGTPLLSDEAFVFHPSIRDFDTAAALRAAGSGLVDYKEVRAGGDVSAAETIDAIALDYSISPKVLLALLEWRGGLVSAPVADRAAVDGVFGYLDSGLAAQLDGAARALFDAFYAHRADPSSAPHMPNAGTAALSALPAAGRAADATDAADFAAVYARLFGDPLRGQLILVTPNSPMPGARLPWTAGEAWNYNSGPHNDAGGTFGCSWGAPTGCPAPWSAIDVAPLDGTTCKYDDDDPTVPDGDNDEGEVYDASAWAVASRGGTLRHGSAVAGTVIIDHGDGWTTYYTHLAPTGKTSPGDVARGEQVGHPSCQGHTSGIHLHFAVAYQGAFVNIDGTNLGGWTVARTTHYNGTMTCPDGRRQTAITSRLATSKIEDNCRPPAAAQLSVVLIIDSSGSMIDNDPLRLRVEAAKAFIDAAQPGDEIGVVEFESSSRLLAPLTVIQSAAQKDALKAAVDNVGQYGSTNINAGLNTGFAALSAAAGLMTNRAAILLTDGDHNIGPYDDNSHLQYASKSWAIYTVGLGQANQALLRRIAEESGGNCVNNCQPLANAGLLGQVYQDMRARLTSGTTLTSAQFLIQQGEQHHLSANVMPNQLTAQFYVGWQGSEMELALAGPGGRVINHNQLGPDVTHAQGDTYELYTINYPQQGVWEMTVSGVDVPPEGETVTVYAASQGIHYLYQPLSLVQPTPTPPTCANAVANPSFEENASWQINANEYPAAYWWGFGHTGVRSMRIGINYAYDNRYSYSSIEQAVHIPSPLVSAKLGYWLYPQTSEPVAALTPPAVVPTSSQDRAKLSSDAQMVLLLHGQGQQTVLRFMRQNPEQWVYYEDDLSAFRGQTVRLYFGVFNNGWGGITAMWADDVTVDICRQ